jgi:hypothetical protein
MPVVDGYETLVIQSEMASWEEENANVPIGRCYGKHQVAVLK